MRPAILFALTLTPALLLAQSAPIKMGLWEKKMIITRGTAPPMNMNTKSCVTPENWNEMVANASKQHEGCTSNTVKNAHGYTFTSSCNVYGSQIESHGTLTIQDSEHIVSETHSTTTGKGPKVESELHATMHHLSATCGTVKPGEPQEEE